MGLASTADRRRAEPASGPAARAAERRGGSRRAGAFVAARGPGPDRSGDDRRLLPHRRRPRATAPSARAGRRRHCRRPRARREFAAVEIAHPRRSARQAARRHPVSGDHRPQGRRVRPHRRRARQGTGPPDRPDRPQRRGHGRRRGRGAGVRRGRPRHAPSRRRRRRSRDLRLPLVSALDRALPQAARPGPRRLAVRAGVRPADADILPAHRRQSAGSQGLVDPGGDRRRHAGARRVRTRCCSSCAPTR